MSKVLPRALPLWAFPQLKEETAPMVFITGARQVGKTYMVRKLDAPYFNWDTVEARKAWSQDPYFFRGQGKLVIFDEIHKRRDWKKILKGYYDSPDRNENFIVTGSGRMDQYQRSGDSLQGRYNSYQLWPLSFDEIHSSKKLRASAPRDWKNWEPAINGPTDESLINLGGFPAPFLSGKSTTLRRWQDQYIDRLIREDARDFSAVQRLDQVDLLARLLPDRVGSPLSILNLSEDIEASTVGVKSWLRLLETLYLGFLVRPYHRKIHRAVKKEAKWYFQQWTYVENPGGRFENYLAVQLSSHCSALSEQGLGRWELFYLRDQDRREVDFLITCDMKPQVLIEAKSSEQSWTSALDFYCKKLEVPGFLIYPKGKVRRIEKLGWCLPSARFLTGLHLQN